MARKSFKRKLLGRSDRPSSRPAARPRRLVSEPLDERCVLTSNLYIDFGDNLPTGGLLVTQLQLRDTFANGGIQGPDLRGFSFSAPIVDATTFQFQSMRNFLTFDYNGDGGTNTQDYTDLSTAILSLVQRYYAPFDVNVQLAPVIDASSSANYLAGIRTTLQQGLAVDGERDQWVFVMQANRTDNSVDLGTDTSLYGIATANDIGGNNSRDDVSLVFTSTLTSDFPNATADTAIGRTTAHEAGHNFGLEHSASWFTNDALLNLSDIIQAGGSTFTAQRTNYNMFTRYPLRTQVSSGFVVDSGARLMNTNVLGPRAGAPDYVTGTGAHDIITITNGAGNTATVTVQAFSNTGRTTSIPVPVIGGAAYFYTVNKTNGIFIDAGNGDDQIVLDANLNVPVTIRGMLGTDELVINNATGAGTFTPNVSTTVGLDGITSYGATAVFNGGTFTVTLSEFETTSLVTVTSGTSLTYRTPNPVDVLVVDTFGGRNRVSGTSSGVAVIPVSFSGITSVDIDSATADGAGGDDLITISTTFVSTGLTNFTVNTGNGNDRLIANLSNFALPGAGAFTFNGGNDSDTVQIQNDVATMTVNAASVASSGGGQVVVASVETVDLVGGASANAYVINGWQANVNIAGGAGTDRLSVLGNAAPSGMYTPGAAQVNGIIGNVVVGTLNVNFSQFETGSDVTITNLNTLTLRTPNPIDAVTIDSSGANGRVQGTSSSVGFVQLLFSTVTNMILDTGAFDLGAGADSITFAAALTATGLQTFRVNSGAFDDTLTVTALNYTLPGGGGFTFDGGDGNDTIATVNNVAAMTVAGLGVSINGAGTIGTVAVENATLTGGVGANTYLVSSSDFVAVSLNGADGADTATVGAGDLDGVLGTITFNGGNQSDTLVINDATNSKTSRYRVASDGVFSTQANGDDRLFGVARFGTTVEIVTVNGSTGANVFDVTPSTFAVLNVNGNTPTAVGPGVDELVTNLIGTGGRVFNNVGGNGSWTFPGSGVPLFGVRAPVNFTNMELFNNFTSFMATGAEAGARSQPMVKIVDAISGEVVEFLAYESNYRQGVRVFTGDLTGDGKAEIITAPRRGRAPELRVFTLQGVELTQFRTMAYAANFRNGVNVAVADVDGDGFNDIITSPDRGVAEIRVFKNMAGASINASPIFKFNAFPTTFVGGASIAADDFNNDGKAEIVVGSGSGTRQQATVLVFDPTTLPAAAAVTPAAPPAAFRTFTGFFDANFYGGVNISVGRINGDLTPDIVVAQGAGGKSLVAVINGVNGQVLSRFSAYTDSGTRAAATYVAARDFDKDGIIDWIFTGQAPDGRTRSIRQFKPTLPTPTEFPLFGPYQFAGFNIG